MALTAYVDEPVEVLPKDPDAKLIYKFNWTDWLDGDEIAASTWSVYPSGSLTVLGTNFDTTSTVIRVEGGTPGERYDLTNHITTHNTGEEEDRTFRLEITER